MTAVQVSEKTRHAIAARSQGRCEKCGSARAVLVHHRKPRGRGGTHGAAGVVKNGLANLLHLCNLCHDRVEGNRARSLAQGWLVDQHEDSALRPVLLCTINFGVARVLLSDEGGVDLAPGDDCVDCDAARAEVVA